MNNKLAPIVVLLLAAGCATGPMTSASTAAEDKRAIAKTTEYVLLSSPTAVRDWNAMDPEVGLHVRGTMTTHGFVPVGGVQGRGKLCTDGRDWVSFADLRIHKATEGGTPAAPYILGCASGSKFVPASREIVAQE